MALTKGPAEHWSLFFIPAALTRSEAVASISVMTTQRSLLAFAVLAICLGIANAQSTRPVQSADVRVTRLRTELEPKITEAIKQSHLPGFAIGVVKDGRLVYAKGFGVSKLGTNA